MNDAAHEACPKNCRTSAQVPTDVEDGPRGQTVTRPVFAIDLREAGAVVPPCRLQCLDRGDRFVLVPRLFHQTAVDDTDSIGIESRFDPYNGRQCLGRRQAHTAEPSPRSPEWSSPISARAARADIIGSTYHQYGRPCHPHGSRTLGSAAKRYQVHIVVHAHDLPSPSARANDGGNTRVFKQPVSTDPNPSCRRVFRRVGSGNTD